MRENGSTRDAVLEKAVSLASQVGLEGLTIGRLAEELKISKSGLFAHFGSKEALQIETLERASEHFTAAVIRPGLAAPPGEPRVRALFERWLEWPRAMKQPGGCIWMAAAVDLDDRPGPARDRLVQLLKRWLGIVADVVRTAVAKGHFRRGVDSEQFAFDLYGIALAAHHASRLLEDPAALRRAHGAFEALVAAARPRRT